MTSVEPQSVFVREYKLGDAGALRDIAVSAYEVHVVRMKQRPEPMDLDYERVALEQSLLIACVDETPVGFVAYILEDLERRILVHNLAINPAYQGMGLGSLLLDSAEALGQGAGMTHSELYTNVSMVENLAFYKNRGYEVLGRRTVRSYDRIFLSKKI